MASASLASATSSRLSSGEKQSSFGPLKIIGNDIERTAAGVEAVDGRRQTLSTVDSQDKGALVPATIHVREAVGTRRGASPERYV